MRTGYHHNNQNTESAVANLIEYLMITGVILALFVVMILLINTNIMEDPANRLVYVAFTDIGNGVSTRIVDVYSIGPQNGTVTTKFDIPDEIVGKSYFVDVGQSGIDQEITVSRGYLNSHTSLSGIAASLRGAATGRTTGGGMNIISYNSGGNLT
jgi:hypothetical protein